MGTYSYEVDYYAEPLVRFDVPESGVYCIEWSVESGKLEVFSWIEDLMDTSGAALTTEALYVSSESYATSVTTLWQFEEGHSYVLYGSGYGLSTVTLTVTKVGTDAEDEDFVPVWRVYNPYSGEHHFTVDQNEYSTLVSLGWTGEGICWLAPEESSTPVYRLYNPYSGDHHYTTNATEVATLVALGWEDEGIGWYSSGSGTAVYRLYNPFVTSYYHHYTVDSNEYATLLTLGWSDEQVGWYGL